MRLILGSSSKYRKEVLKNITNDFDTLSPDIDEKNIRHENPEDLTLAIAEAKMEAILSKTDEPAIIITSDQVVTWNEQIREKPVDEKEARYFMKSSHLAPAKTVTAVVVANTTTNQRFSGVDIAQIWFKKIPENTIQEILSDGEIYFCAGGFNHEHHLIKPFVEKIEGATDSISGLPLELTLKLLKQAGYEIKKT